MELWCYGSHTQLSPPGKVQIILQGLLLIVTFFLGENVKPPINKLKGIT